MSHAIIRGKGGRRHEVDFGDAPIRVEVHASEETVEILSRRISRRTRKSGGGLRFSTSHVTSSVKLLARRQDAQQRKIADALAFRRQIVQAAIMIAL
jgi:hypothetical protein